MENNNPAEMSNEDLEKDMEQRNLQMPSGNQEHINKSTASEGTLKTPDQDESSKVHLETKFQADQEQDLDDLIHTQAAEKEASDAGSIPDPEALDNWEANDDDLTKITG